MKTRAYVMLGLAMLLAIASVFMARTWIQNQIQPVAQVDQKPQVETTKILVAASQLKYGNKIHREHLRLVDWPVSAVPEGAFRSYEEILGKETKDGAPLKGRIVLRSIEVNEPILATKITGLGGRASLSMLISPGMRATTIRVNDVNGVAGFVLPGDRVDILLTRDPKGGGRKGGKNLTTDILLQNMKVLGIGQDANEDRSKPAVVKAVTLEVTTTQAQKLTLAARLGSLSLALRNVNTVDAFEPVSITARDLKVGEANQAPDPLGAKIMVESTEKKAIVSTTVTTVTKKKKKLPSVRIVRGIKASEYEVEREAPTFSAPAYSKPLNLLPSKLPPTRAPAVTTKLAPLPTKLTAPTLPTTQLVPAQLTLPQQGPAKSASKGEIKTDANATMLPSAEPVSLLKGSSSKSPGDDG